MLQALDSKGQPEFLFTSCQGKPEPPNARVISSAGPAVLDAPRKLTGEIEFQDAGAAEPIDMPPPLTTTIKGARTVFQMHVTVNDTFEFLDFGKKT